MVKYGIRFGAVALASLGAVLAAPTAAGAAVIFSSSENLGCGKSGCLSQGGRFEQTFSGGDFRGLVSISALQLDRNILGDLAGQTFRLSFSLSDGTALGSWGTWTMAGIGGEVWNIDGADFDWNADAGDLVMTIELVRRDSGAGGGGFGFGGGGARAPLESGAGGPGAGVPGAGSGTNHSPPPFNLPANHPIGGAEIVANPVAVPEPDSWALMILGFGGAGALLRMRRARAFA